jgi:hypothetical protein
MAEHKPQMTSPPLSPSPSVDLPSWVMGTVTRLSQTHIETVRKQAEMATAIATLSKQVLEVSQRNAQLGKIADFLIATHIPDVHAQFAHRERKWQDETALLHKRIDAMETRIDRLEEALQQASTLPATDELIARLDFVFANHLKSIAKATATSTAAGAAPK